MPMGAAYIEVQYEQWTPRALSDLELKLKMFSIDLSIWI